MYRVILSPLFGYVNEQTIAVLAILPALALANPTLFTRLLMLWMLLALLLITQWPRIVPQESPGSDGLTM